MPATTPTELRHAAVVRLGLLVAVALAGLQAVAHLVDYFAFDLRIALLNSSVDESVAGWASWLALGAVATVAAARAAGGARRRPLFAAVAVVATFLFVESAVGLHDGIPRWSLVYLPIFVAFVVALELSLRGEPPVARNAARGGVLVLLASLFFHNTAPELLRAVGVGEAHWLYAVKVALKEGSELAGWLLIAAGLGAGLERVARAASRARPASP